MGKPLRETRRHQSAFELYYILGQERSYAAVARQFGISQAAAGGWGSAFGWDRRVQERDRIVSEMAAGMAIEDAAKARAFQLRLTRATMARWAQTLGSGKAEVSAADFIKAAQHELLLLGKATSRSEVVSSGAAQVVINVVLAAIERVCPERCSKCGSELRIKAALSLEIASQAERLSGPAGAPGGDPGAPAGVDSGASDGA